MTNENDIRLIQRLEGGTALSAQELANYLGISRTSVYRVIQRCENRGYNIVREHGRFRLASRDRDAGCFEFSLSAQQAHDLVAAVESVLRLTPYAAEALEVLRKTLIGSKLVRPSAVYYHSYDEIDPGVYQRVVAAIEQRKVLELTYKPTNVKRSLSQHTFEPYRIIFWNGHYYLVGRSRTFSHKPGGGLMHLRLDRILEAKVALAWREGQKVPDTLTFPEPDFDPQAYVERSFGTFGGDGEPEEVVLHFPAHNAKAAAEVQRHPSRELLPQDDGSLIYKLTVPVTEELVWWAASWKGLRVLAPDHLREKVRRHCLELAYLNQ